MSEYADSVDVDTKLKFNDVLAILKRVFVYVWPVKGLFLIKFVLMLGSLIPIVVAPWPIKILVDHVILAQPLEESTVRFPPFIQPFVDLMITASPETLLIATVLFLLLLLVTFGAGLDDRMTLAFLAQGQDTATQSENMTSAGWSRAGGIWGLSDLLCNIRLVQRVTNGLRTHLFQRLMRLPMRVLDDHRIGDGVYRTMYDAPSVQGVCFDLTLMPTISILGALATVYVMHYSFGTIIPELVWLALATLPLSLAFTVPLSDTSRRASQASRGAGSSTTSHIEQNMSNIAAVQSHGRQEDDSFADASEDSFRQFRRVVAVNIAIEITSTLALGIVALWVFLLVTDRIIVGELSPGDFLVVFGLFGAIAGTSMTLGRLWVDLQGNVAGVRRVLFYIDLPNDHTRKGIPAPNVITKGIEFEKVDLIYPDGREALSEVSFEAPVGQTVALVGPTGAGKTSLAYMIPGFINPTRGRVMLDGEDIGAMDIEGLRNMTTYVFQEHYLLADTIANNIRLGKPDATDEEIRNVAEASGAAEFIERLPDGYQTVLGRDGGKLSVGQKQRLSIARGLMRDTPILILDEPTAALDPDTERALISALNAVKQNRIIFVIAHRLSTISSADQILFMEDGRIVEQGSHSELMDADGRYAHFVNLQRT